jgi:RNA polymerase sigma factor (sigma-70 family)
MAAAAVEATDEQLVAATRAGSDTAFEALFRRYRDRIAAYVRGMVSDHGRVEDIVQDVFISAHRSLLGSERAIAFRPWVYEIAKNACIDHARRARRAREVSIDSDDFSDFDEGRLSAGVAGTDAAVSRRQELDSLKMAFEELPEQQHEILVMRELEGLSYDKISSRMGLSRSAVESTLFRARRRLKDEFDDISTGERCLRMQAVLAKLSNGGIGIREERRLSGHLRNCVGCRREAVALGLDELALWGVAGRARSAISRAASFLPLPAFLRRRLGDSLNALGAGGSAGVEQGASFAAKAVVLVAAAAIVGGGAGVVHKAVGDSSKRAGDSGASQRQGGEPATGAEGGDRNRAPGTAGARGADDTRGPGGPGGPGGLRDGAGGGGGAGSAPASKAGGDLGGAKGVLGQSLESAGSTAQGAGGKAGSLVDGLSGSNGGLDSTVDGVTKGTGDALQKVGGAGSTIDSATDGAGNTVKSVGDTLKSAPSTTTQQVQPTLNQVTSTLPQTSVTTPSVKLPSTNLGL